MRFVTIIHHLGLCSLVATNGWVAEAASRPATGKSTRQYTRLHSGWRFKRWEAIPDGVVYGHRNDTLGQQLLELKPWILPVANDFIKDEENHHETPDDPPNIDIEYADVEFDDGDWEEVNVPHDWAINGPYLTGNDAIIPSQMGSLPSHGIGWYRRALEFGQDSRDKKIQLEVEGVMNYPTVWLNGKLVGGWPMGYNSFFLDLTPHIDFGKSNVLAIRADGPVGHSSRWYTGGGIFRDVWLVETSSAHIANWGTFVTTSEVSEMSATVNIDVTVQNSDKKKRDLELQTDIFVFDAAKQKRGKRVGQSSAQRVTVDSGRRESASASASIQRPALWGPPPQQKPNLYVAVTKLWDGKTLLDEYETTFGVRTIEPRGDGLFVNGERIKLQGVNQHHDLGAIGAAFNVHAARRQLDILKDLGVNAIRTAHNPPAPALLSLTDEMGFLVIDEIFDVWAMPKAELDFHLIFPDWKEPDLRSFIRRDRNHPSIVLWSFGNEVPEQYQHDDLGAEISMYLRDIAHEEDPTRKTTLAFNFAEPHSAMAAAAEVISLNYQGEGIRDSPGYEPYVGGIRRTPQYGPHHEMFPEKMIVGSEVGSSVSSRGFFTFPVTPYNSAAVNATFGGNGTSLEISAYELYTAPPGASGDKIFGAYDVSPFVAGGFVWTGFDYIGEPTPYNGARSSFFGIIDLAGFKKERFWLYQSWWRPEVKSAKIVPHWNWPDREGKVTPVHVFSSADEAELFVNGESQGRVERKSGEYRFRWDEVKYEAGEVEVKTWKNGKEWAEDKVQTTGEASSLRLTANRKTVLSDGEDLVYVTAEVVDSKGRVVPVADNAIAFTVEGPGEVVATDNGLNTDLNPFNSAERDAYHGLALAVVRSKPGRSGRITVKAESSGLGGANIRVTSST